MSGDAVKRDKCVIDDVVRQFNDVTFVQAPLCDIVVAPHADYDRKGAERAFDAYGVLAKGNAEFGRETHITYWDYKNKPDGPQPEDFTEYDYGAPAALAL